MSNRTFLIESNSEFPVPRRKAPSVALAAGKNSIPLYWFSLFDENCIIYNEIFLEGGKLEKYPYLVVPTPDAIKSLTRKILFLENLSPNKGKIMVEQWVRLIACVQKPFIHLDPAELCLMLEEGKGESYIRECLKLFEQAPGDFATLKQNSKWKEMLDVAQIAEEDMAGSATPMKLMGYPY